MQASIEEIAEEEEEDEEYELLDKEDEEYLKVLIAQAQAKLNQGKKGKGKMTTARPALKQV